MYKEPSALQVGDSGRQICGAKGHHRVECTWKTKGESNK